MSEGLSEEPLRHWLSGQAIGRSSKIAFMP
jgi:hypothetical protein